MNTTYLHYKAEIAFDRLEEALLGAQEQAFPEEKLLYGRLMDELIGVRDRARAELLAVHTKKTAPAAGTTGTAKSDSVEESAFSLDEKEEDVKRVPDLSPDSQAEFLKLGKKLGLPDAFLQKFIGGAGK